LVWFGLFGLVCLVRLFGSYLQLLFEKYFIFLQLLQDCRCILYFTSVWIVLNPDPDLVRALDPDLASKPDGAL